MGQYYKFIILADNSSKEDKKKECILLVINPRTYSEGSKLMEHSYINTNMMNAVEFLISKHGRFYKSRIVWAGDYAEPESEEEDEDGPLNLYRISDEYSSYTTQITNSSGRYIVNHTKKLYVDKEWKAEETEETEENNYRYIIHPLPLLISEGNGNGGGDYRGNNEQLCGRWARDVISIEDEIPDN